MNVVESIQDTRAEMLALGAAAKSAAKALATADTAQKDRALQAMAGQIRSRVDDILSANAVDVALAESLDRRASFIDRLTLTAERIEAMAQGVESIAGLPDLIGRMGEVGLLSNDQVAITQAAVTAFSSQRDSRGRAAVDLPITFREGYLFVGPLRLARISPVL